ncbi:MAG TPA: hypothetical protein VGR90_05470 [Acidimicrobiales bacterium]|nr:hypothetical protein [Acidimicrobiales bacterium]
MTTRVALGRVGAIAEMLARDLGRRRTALALIVALPLAFYGISRTSGPFHLTAGGIGAAWSVSAAALFAALGGRAVDERLVLDGYRPAELFIGRLVILLGAAAALCTGVGLLMLVVSSPPDPAAMWVAMALVAGVAVPFGLAVGALVPHELEGILLLIGVTGIQTALPSSSAIVGAFPFGGAQRLLDRASYASFPPAPALYRSLGWMVLLVLVALAAWRYRLQVGRRRGSRRDWAKVAVAPVVGTLVGTALIVVSVNTTNVVATSTVSSVVTRAAFAVINQWGLCLSYGGANLGIETGNAAVSKGQRGLIITVGGEGGPTFFVPNAPIPARAVPDNQDALAALRRGEAADPGCPGPVP